MAATTRRARNYKEKSSGFTFGHFALPIASVIALVLLFVGIKLFFLTPPEKIGVEVTRTVNTSASQYREADPIDEPDFSLSIPDVPSEGGILLASGAAETNSEAIVLASPLTQTGAAARVSSSAAKNETKREIAVPAKSVGRIVSQAASNPNSKWGVQVGAFVNEGSASTLVTEIKNQGYLASISKVDSSGKTFHRVRIGAGNTREDAAKLATELEQKGYPVSVVPML